ncbi:histidine kinase [Nocardioides sp. cx-169]|uniref:sensor histidine kinase n=1 Tax=Nocardioides sp. cx-169 TaxID=2899080 RepID=UPI001E5E7896|nr:histidine kinase [Nocardioides sp. cx-169]MCD4534685.1 histidine kinase [Nocardioides sp. cx-169]
MTDARRHARLVRLTTAGRAFVLLAMGVHVLWRRDVPAAWALLAVAITWTVAQLVAWRAPHVRVAWLEAAVVGLVCGLSLGWTTGVLAALTLAPFVGGLLRGFAGMAVASAAQLAGLLGGALAVHGPLSVETGLAVFTWTVTGLGAGGVAAYVRAAVPDGAPDADAPYRDAQGLLRQLIDLSGGLSSGLDVGSLGGALLSQVHDHAPAQTLALYVRRGETVVPLLEDPPVGPEAERLAAAAWATRRIQVEGRAFAFPLGEGSIVAGTLSERVELDLQPRLEEVRTALGSAAVQLDTALLFSAFRDAATADERRRLSREMHDGIAQDIASLGYLVDALAARPADPRQAGQLAALRERISTIVSEVRQSVLTLRTSVGESESLGAAVGTLARHLSEVSGVPIAVTLDEHSTRLRAEVEAELFRITQEAMTNAVRHARAGSVEVVCQVYPPEALITVTDDGRGLQQRRPDSHGLAIMRERADLIGADLAIGDGVDGGLRIAVRLGRSAQDRVAT